MKDNGQVRMVCDLDGNPEKVVPALVLEVLVLRGGVSKVERVTTVAHAAVTMC